jgi:hypothetical protein
MTIRDISKELRIKQKAMDETNRLNFMIKFKK